MQFHVSGYQTGDPMTMPAQGTGIDRPTDLPETMDVLIVGCGPAGSIAAAQLSQFPDVNTRMIEQRGHRLELANADGVHSRTMETFQAFGFAHEIFAEGPYDYRHGILETKSRQTRGCHSGQQCPRTPAGAQ